MDISDLARLANHKQQQAKECWIRGNYEDAIALYQQLAEIEPTVKLHYWHLGLMYLLQGQVEEARTIWLMAMLEGDSEEIDRGNQDLVNILQLEAERQENLNAAPLAWRIRQEIREIAPTEINNLLHLLLLAIHLNLYTEEELADWEVIPLLESLPSSSIEFQQLVAVVRQVLQCFPWLTSSLELTAASLHHATTEAEVSELLLTLLESAIKISAFQGRADIAAKLGELALNLAPHEPEVFYQLARFYQDSQQYEKGIETAKQYLAKVEGAANKLVAYRALLHALAFTGGHWQEASLIFERQQNLLREFIEQEPTPLTPIQVSRLYGLRFFAPYFRDEPRLNGALYNRLASLCQTHTQLQHPQKIARYFNRQEFPIDKRLERRLKIGFLSHCFKSHSVGWLARWLFEYADREQFDLYLYAITDPNATHPLQEWYAERATQTFKSTDSAELAEKIYRDRVDILVELDSITLDRVCEVIALKPAPIQVTWLGWDASGIPTIDYFIADPYVLPESAPDYYTEKIWRLPQTYIAVEGFEIDVPTLKRNELEIEPDAIVYLSAQIGYKRHPDTVRLQMEIVKQVPNSYFLIKGSARLDSVRTFFTSMAEEVGFDPNRLRFLPLVSSEKIHRANLTIADIVLDTYPYNGATTTLETLWMGIPLVTRVGEQFAARNSYTMMMNAGITEGIAWTDEEYVEWGVRLGKDEELRKEISWKLKKSRQTAPLWNGKQFTREMEKAYREMWRIYVEGE